MSPTPPPPPPAATRARRSGMPRWLLALLIAGGGLVLLVGGGLVALGIALEAGRLPDTMAIPGSELSSTATGVLLEEDIIQPGEEVLYYYSSGFLSFREDGNLFTDQRVISYWEEEDVLEVEFALYAEVFAIELVDEGGTLEDATIRVTRDDQSQFDLWVSTEDGGHQDFHRLLLETWHERR